MGFAPKCAAHLSKRRFGIVGHKVPATDMDRPLKTVFLYLSFVCQHLLDLLNFNT